MTYCRLGCRRETPYVRTKILPYPQKLFIATAFMYRTISPRFSPHLVVADAYLVRVPESHNAALAAATTTNDATVQEEGKGCTEDMPALSGAGHVDRGQEISHVVRRKHVLPAPRHVLRTIEVRHFVFFSRSFHAPGPLCYY